MVRSNPWQSYRKVATQTASPGHLVVMLYDGAIRFLDMALQGFAVDDPGEFNTTINNNVVRAQAIIDELNQTLDVAQGGEFAVRMRGLYNYFDRRLQESNLRKEPEGIKDVITRLSVLRDAWREMLQQNGSAQPEYVPSLNGVAA